MTGGGGWPCASGKYTSTESKPGRRDVICRKGKGSGTPNNVSERALKPPCRKNYHDGAAGSKDS